MSSARLIAREGIQTGNIYLLDRDETVIGSSAGCTIVLSSSYISRRHAAIRRHGEGYTLVDLGSKNGTLLNGRSVTEPMPLHDGDVITLPTDPDLVLEVALTEATVTRAQRPPSTPTPLRVDLRTAEVWAAGTLVSLTAKEFLALSVLYAEQGGLVTKEQFAARVWPEYEGAVADFNVEQLIARIRRKLEDAGLPRCLVTVRGLGYRLLTG